MIQIPLFAGTLHHLKSEEIEPFRPQLLKWVGNKQRFAHEIISYFPEQFGVYFEPFLGSGAVLATLRPVRALASDISGPLIHIFKTLRDDPEQLCAWYAERWHQLQHGDKKQVYTTIRDSFNLAPNPADLLFISRVCYGGVIRFRRGDGYISTPVGAHHPISPENFAHRVKLWHERTRYVDFQQMSYAEAMSMAQPGDLIYCDPPYHHSESILYGAQSFDLRDLLERIAECKAKGVFVALSIDGTKRSGNHICDLPIPDNLFTREVFVNVGPSMLKRFQMLGKSVATEGVTDRLLLTY